MKMLGWKPRGTVPAAICDGGVTVCVSLAMVLYLQAGCRLEARLSPPIRAANYSEGD